MQSKKNQQLFAFLYILLIITCSLIKQIGSVPIPAGVSPMRITIDYSQIDKGYVNQEQKEYIKTVFTLFSQFLSNLLQVKPRTSVIKNGGLLYCRDTFIGMDGITGYKNTDLVIVVSATNSIFEDFRARYNFCKWDNRPVMMEARYHMSHFKKNAVNFEVNEIFRSFMFNGMWNTDNLGYWVDDTSGNTYSSTSKILQKIKINGVNKWFMTGKYIKEAVQKHFNCPSALGLQVSDSNYMSNYIPDDLFNDEQIRDYENRKLSQFDIAIIKDMGVYEYVNETFADEILWGKNAGCAVLESMCDYIYKETKQVDNILYGCTQFKTSKYIKAANEVKGLTTSGKCPRVTLTNSFSCQNVTLSNSNTDLLGEVYGFQSKCIESTVQNRTASVDPRLNVYIYRESPVRCHYVECNRETMTLNIKFTSNQKISCLKPSQEVVVDTLDFFGTITCPSDFSYYCASIFCPNDCSAAGFCNNGVCSCLEGRFGIDCSIVCKNANKSLCQCQFPCSKCQSTEDTCSECHDGYELVFGKRRCQQICHPSCLSCSKPLDSQSCTQCEFGFVLIQGECIACLSPCKKCSEKRDICTDCIEQYVLNTRSRVCQPKCDESCKSCWKPLDYSACLKCFDGYYLTGYTSCEKCDFNCRQCNGESFLCTDCYDNYYLDIVTATCMPQCTSNCLECTIPLDLFSCIKCSTGYFLKDGRCFNCLNSASEYKNNVIPVECQNIITSLNCNQYCKLCLTDSLSTCVSCISSKNTVGIPSCQCDNSFNFMNRKCQHCEDNQYFDQTLTQCKPCYLTCTSCFGPTSSQCSSCNQLAYQYLDPNTKECLCIDPQRSMVYNTQMQKYTCELGMLVTFQQYVDAVSIPKNQQFYAKFTLPIQSSSEDQLNVFASFSFQINEISQDDYLIRIDKYLIDSIIFSIVQLKSFAADVLIITIRNNRIIKALDGRSIQQSQLNTQQMLAIGPLFIHQKENEENPIHNQFNKALSFIQYNENIKTTITFFNQFSIFLYFLNTIQPSALLILINTNLPPVLYSFQRIFALFIFEDVPDQFVLRSQNKCSMKLFFTIDFCDQNAKNSVTEERFERLGMSYSFPLNTAKVLNQFVLFFLLYLIAEYLLTFNPSFSILHLNSQHNKNSNNINMQNTQQTSKIIKIAQRIRNKSYDLFFSTFEANILLICISAHLQLRAQLISNQDLLLFRLSLYSFSIFIIFLIYLMASAYKMIQEQKLEDFSYDVKQDGNNFCKYFHYLNLVKKWIVCAAHVELYYYPSTLISFVIAVYSLFLLLTIVHRPFKSQISNIQRIIGDSLFIFVYICIYITHHKMTQIQQFKIISPQAIYDFNLWGLIACYSLFAYNLLYLLLFLINVFNKLYPFCKRKNTSILFLNILMYTSEDNPSQQQNNQKKKKNKKKQNKQIQAQCIQAENQQIIIPSDNGLSPINLTLDSQLQFSYERNNKNNFVSKEEQSLSLKQIQDGQNQAIHTQINKKVIKQKQIQLTGNQKNELSNQCKYSAFGVPILMNCQKKKILNDH